jgi:N-acetylmuramoyl-L-alanine amidase
VIKNNYFNVLVRFFLRCAGLVRQLVMVLLAIVLVVATMQVRRAEAAAAVVATGMHISTAGPVTQVQFDLTGAIDFSTDVADSRRTVTVRAQDLTFKLSRGAVSKVKGLVKSVRFGTADNGQGEIIIETRGPVTVRNGFLAVAKRSKKVRMTIILSQDLAAAESALPEQSDADITASLPPATLDQQSAGNKPLIVIDPGHGGIDPGAISASGTMEKDVVLAFAKTLQTALLANRTVDVALTRDTDAFLPLKARVDVAHMRRADLMIAIHADTLRNHTVQGTTLYLLSDKASDTEAEALAQKENRVDALAGIDLGTQSSSVADVLVNLAQRESKNRAAMFAEVAVEKLKPSTKFTGQPLRSAGFVVLKAPDVPSVLIELGYLSNAQDEKNLKSAVWQKGLAQPLADAIQSHFRRFSPATAQASP